MANDVNDCTFTGRLTRDPELRRTSNGTAVTNFGLAVERSWKVDDNWNKKVVFLECVAWNGNGENVAGKYRKGDEVLVKAGYETREWTDTEDKKRIAPQFNVFYVKLSSSRKPVVENDENDEKPSTSKKRGRPRKVETKSEPTAQENTEEDDIDF